MLHWPADATVRGLLLNTWLQVTVRVNNNTRLPTPDVFYFGNLAGDTGGPALTVDTLDIARTRSAMPTPAATIDSLYDHNRDGRVNSIDLATTRVHQTAGLAALGHPAPPAAAASTAGLVAVSVAPTDRRKSPDRMAAYVL